MRTTIAVLIACLHALAGCGGAPLRSSPEEAKQQVTAAERAFAKTMADRDHAAFTAMLSEEALFVIEPKTLRGRAEVSAAWKRFYERPAAPFSWEPETVEVLDSGTLALSTGPVRNPTGKIVATYMSIWRLEPPGVWRIIFDRGNDVCDCPKP